MEAKADVRLVDLDGLREALATIIWGAAGTAVDNPVQTVPIALT